MPVDLAALEFKERVKQATDVVDLVSGYMRLMPAGRIFKGHCPWHDDHRPSFQVDPIRQTVRCWVCNIGGDVFQFVMQTEKLGFREALEFLADRAGIPLPAFQSAGSGGDGDRNAFYKALAWAEQTFHNYLLEAAAAGPARKYLLERGFTDESIHDFRLGYASPDGGWLLQRASQAKIASEVLLKTGLVARRDVGAGFYDCFRDRVMFPIHDPQGRTIAFGGRILPGSTHPAKYVNTSGTSLFDKKRVLFGLDTAAQGIRKAGSVLVMEGYTDCLIARQHGVSNCVAVLGTALGEAHIQLLQRYTDSVILVLDGDAAGKTRAEQVLELFLTSRLNLRVLTLPDNMDPCDYVLTHGADTLVQAAERAPDALDYKVAAAVEGIEPGDGSHASNAALEDILRVFARMETQGGADAAAKRLRLDQMLTKLARRFRVADNTLRHRLQSLKAATSNRSAGAATTLVNTAESVGIDSLNAWHKELLELLLCKPDFAEQLPRDLLKEDLGPAGPILQAIFDLIDEGLPSDYDHIMLALQSSHLQTLLIDLDASARDKQQHSNAISLADRWKAMLDAFQRRSEQRRHASELAGLREDAANENEQLAKLLRMRQDIRNRFGIAEPTEG